VKSILSILDEIEAVNSPLEKQRIIKKNNSHELRLVLEAAYNPYKMYYVRKVPDVKPSKTSKHSLLYVRDNLLESLSERRATGHDAMERVLKMLRELSADDGEVLRRILKKDLRCNIAGKTINAVFPKLIPDFKVQLAAGDPSKAVYPCFIEPKKDGMRVLAFVKGETVKFLTRGGRPMTTLKAIEDELLTGHVHPTGYVLDGEIQAGRFQKTLSSVKRKTAQTDLFERATDSVRFIVFDCLTIQEFNARKCTRTYDERRDALNQLQFGGEHVAQLQPTLVKNATEAQAYYKARLNAGDEGAMLKDPKGLYEFKRSRAWIKMKPSKTVDVTITGFKEGKGKLKGSCGAILFKYKGQTCSAGGMKHAEGKHLWKNREYYAGKLAEVEFTEETDGGRTRHARYVKLREHKGERT
jgi:ATP-dependent DNA ligase